MFRTKLPPSAPGLCRDVFIRFDQVLRPMKSTYDGQFRVRKTRDIAFLLMVKG